MSGTTLLGHHVELYLRCLDRLWLIKKVRVGRCCREPQSVFLRCFQVCPKMWTVGFWDVNQAPKGVDNESYESMSYA